MTITSRRRLALAATSLVLLLGACADEPSISDQISDDPTIDEGDIGGHDTTGDGAAGGTCPVGTPDCVDADLGSED